MATPVRLSQFVGWFVVIAAVAVALPALADGPAAAPASIAAKVDFNRDVRPLLSKNCFSCHGRDEDHRQAELRLDLGAAAVAPLPSGKRAIVPGKPDESELIRRLTSTDDDVRMPPKERGVRLSPEQVKLLRTWIEQGAAYTDHWSFIPPVPQPLPTVGDPSWPANGIDFFVRARLEQAGLKPSPRADRYALIRRVSLDLRGLPPTPAEVDAFISDTSPDAYERIVDRYLHDPAFGERWARMWLDLARFADSKGYGSDPLREIWLFRDWVIDAFNRNLPYDQFTIEQIAGDLLPDPRRDQLIATAFHRNTMTNTEGGTDDEEFRVAAVRDRVNTTMQVWMGLTFACSQCHSHKYDPISQKEYYQFYAYFNSTADNDQPDESPTITVASPEELARKQQIDTRIAELKKQKEAADEAAKKQLNQQIDELTKSLRELPAVPIQAELPADKQRETFVMLKGNFLTRGEKVGPGVPQSFHPFPAGAPANRLGVAKWLVDANNPLTARVAVNRFWAQLFGTGLVETPEDYGTQGEPPSHPELLDWLAVEFMRHGCDQKSLLRLMVTSETYCQSSKVTPELLEKDPRNRLMSRGPRFRLEAELVRDQALALAGLLSRKMMGPSVFPAQPPGLWQAAFNGRDRTWATSAGEDKFRRGLYTFWRRTVPYPSMATFDAPSREICTVRRIRTNTPLQALVTLNDPVYVEAAQALARRIIREGGTSTGERVDYALKLCLSRPPHAKQIEELTSLFTSQHARYRADVEAARKLATDPLGPLPEGLDPAEMAAWTVVANVLLNLDAVLTKG